MTNADINDLLDLTRRKKGLGPDQLKRRNELMKEFFIFTDSAPDINTKIALIEHYCYAEPYYKILLEYDIAESEGSIRNKVNKFIRTHTS